MSPNPPLPRDVEFARIIAWLQAYNLEAHTDRKGNTVVSKREPKRSKLTGESR